MKIRSSVLRAGLLVHGISACWLALMPLTASALEPPLPGAGLCFGFGSNPFFANVIDNVSGEELIVTNITENVLADTDLDGFSAIRSTVTVRVRDRSGAAQWTSDPLRLFSPDVATVIDGGGFVPDSYLLPGLASNTFAAALFLGGATCYGTIYAVEASGNKYLAVVIGFLTQTGTDEATGVDESRANVWILNRDNGNVEHVHTIRKKGGRFLSAIAISGVGNVDGDTDDELVVAWAQPFGNGTYKMLYETYNVLTGTLEETFSFFTNNSRTFP